MQPSPPPTPIVEIAFGLLAIGALAAGLVALPNSVSASARAKRAEAAANVDGIRAAELAYDAAFDGFVAVSEPAPRPVEALSEAAAGWTRGTAFDALGWSPDVAVRGAYWVEVSAAGRGFTVHGMIDSDGDGEPAHYVATRDQTARLLTDDSVY